MRNSILIFLFFPLVLIGQEIDLAKDYNDFTSQFLFIDSLEVVNNFPDGSTKYQGSYYRYLYLKDTLKVPAGIHLRLHRDYSREETMYDKFGTELWFAAYDHDENLTYDLETYKISMDSSATKFNDNVIYYSKVRKFAYFKGKQYLKTIGYFKNGEKISTWLTFSHNGKQINKKDY